MNPRPYEELRAIHVLLENHALPLLAASPPRAIADACPTLKLPERAAVAVELLQAAAKAHEKRKDAAVLGQDFDTAAYIRDRVASLRELAEKLQQLKRPNQKTLQGVVAELRRASAAIGDAGQSTYP